MKKNTQIVASFPGTGKTTIVERQLLHSSEIEAWKFRGHKGYPNSYVIDVFDKVGEFEYLFIATEPEQLKLLRVNTDIKIHLVYPENELRNEYLQRYIDRDSPHEFIGAFMKYWEKWINELKEQDYCKHTILEPGQYLIDVLR